MVPGQGQKVGIHSFFPVLFWVRPSAPIPKLLWDMPLSVPSLFFIFLSQPLNSPTRGCHFSFPGESELDAVAGTQSALTDTHSSRVTVSSYQVIF